MDFKKIFVSWKSLLFYGFLISIVVAIVGVTCAGLGITDKLGIIFYIVPLVGLAGNLMIIAGVIRLISDLFYRFILKNKK